MSSIHMNSGIKSQNLSIEIKLTKKYFTNMAYLEKSDLYKEGLRGYNFLDCKINSGLSQGGQ